MAANMFDKNFCVLALTILIFGYTHHSSLAETTRTDIRKEQPGGEATSQGSTNNRNAFSNASGNLSLSKEFDFKIGNAVFEKLWVSSPASTKSSDGLGPLYNARSCGRCHMRNGRGHTPAENWPGDNAVSMLLRLSIPPQTEGHRELLASGRANVIPEPTYGTQLQDLAIKGHAGEGRMQIAYKKKTVTFADGETVALRAPSYRITDLSYGPLHPQTLVSPRIAPQMIGLGLLEAIPAQDILAKADPEDRDGDGISGRANRVWSLENNRSMLGRFGWKAGSPTILQQTAEAFAGDIGISSDLIRKSFGDCMPGQAVCRNAPHGESGKQPEIKRSLLNLVAFYSRNIAVPRRRNARAPEARSGEAIFHNTGCAACHIPKLRTGQNSPDPNLRGQTIRPYTDLLLHDMGPGLADGRPEAQANGREWRTAPLWGIGLTKTVSGHTFFLHDGRARNLTEAILWHGGEAQAARDKFSRLSKRERDQLIAFLESL